mgnify:CR=1 FL=1
MEQEVRQLAQVVSKRSLKVLEGEAKPKKETKIVKTKEKPVEEEPETSSDEESEEEAPPTTKHKHQTHMISQKKLYQKEIENLKKQIDKQNSGSSKVIEVGEDIGEETPTEKLTHQRKDVPVERKELEKAMNQLVSKMASEGAAI